MGMPWAMRREDHGIVIGHGGAIDGFGSLIYFIPKSGIGVIGLFNRVDGAPGMSTKIFEIVKETEDAHKAVKPKKKPSATPAEYREFLGTYQGMYEIALKIEYREGSLQAAFIGVGSVLSTVLLPTDEPDVFRAKSGRLAGDKIVLIGRRMVRWIP
jgi:hypothetical protein